MFIPIPKGLVRNATILPRAVAQPIKTKEEKIADIKKKFNLNHGKGNQSQKKRKGK